ncbi:MAG TPA: hypothetical protein VFK88_05545 [Gallionella sp.]|nr:hypothetical protein [Gallionella sp.]
MTQINTAVSSRSNGKQIGTAMKLNILALSAVAAGIFAGAASAATFEWVNGKVTSFTAQLPMYTVAVVDNKIVRFCHPTNGKDYPVNTGNLHYDMLEAAFLNNKNVEVGVQNFGNDPQSGTVKLCIDRVILKN